MLGAEDGYAKPPAISRCTAVALVIRFSGHEAGPTRTRSGPSSAFGTAPRSSRAHRLRPGRGSHRADASPRGRRDGREPERDLARRLRKALLIRLREPRRT